MFPIPKTEAEAAERVAARYAVTYAGLLYRLPLDNAVEAFPPLAAGEFRLVDTSPDDWTFAYEPLSGPAIRARVSRQNGYVEFDSVVVSAE